MESLEQLLNEWEIQLLVLLSFTLQFFLFFTGNLRRHSINTSLRFSIWLAYLGADIVAIYALGFLSRHENDTIGKETLWGTHPLVFFWAPFLLIHLGGQDTITVFSMEDNNLWLRHLLNLVVQVALVLYVFWKSTTNRHNLELLIPAIFVFVAGIIKYGERAWALKCGSSTSRYKEQLTDLDSEDISYYGIIGSVLKSMHVVRHIFAGRSLSQIVHIIQLEELDTYFHRYEDIDEDRIHKIIWIELGLIYDDLYTKAMIIRTRIGVILRCFSQISMMVAFVLFLARNKQIYGRVDVAITYTLFIGCFFLEAGSIFMIVMSPWTWAWLKAREYRWLADMSWFVLSSRVGWPESRPMWSNSMGQYNFLDSLCVGKDQPRLLSKLTTVSVRKMLNVIGVKEPIWFNKLLHTKYVKVDKEVMVCDVKFVKWYHLKADGRRTEAYDSSWTDKNLDGVFLEKVLGHHIGFGHAIVILHVFTDLYLRRYTPNDMDQETLIKVKYCREISNYIMYLFVVHPSMLPFSGNTQDILAKFSQYFKNIKGKVSSTEILASEYLKNANSNIEDSPVESVLKLALEHVENLTTSIETLEAIRNMWMRVLIYVAGRSRPEMHARQLGEGGELLTFVWLLMAHFHLGDFASKIDLIYTDQTTTIGARGCAFDLRSE